MQTDLTVVRSGLKGRAPAKAKLGLCTLAFTCWLMILSSLGFTLFSTTPSKLALF